MIVTSSTAPPPPPCQQSRSVDHPTTHVFKSLDTNTPIQPQSPAETGTAREDPCGNGHFLTQLKVPTVVLDTPSVSHTMAAALSLSLLGHTLFLKNQVPFPVAQLSRMPTSKSSPKVTKKREELLATFDTLASHLHTTFVSLSTAYAKCRLSSQVKSPDVSAKDIVQPQRLADGTSEEHRGFAHLIFVIGPSVGAARARILLTIDGLEVKIWGNREGGSAVVGDDSDGSEADESSECDSEEEDEDSGEDSEEDESEDEPPESDEEEEVSDSEGSEPPPSRSPSPATRSQAPSPESLPSPCVLPTPQASTFELPPSSSRSASTAPQSLLPEPLTTLAPPAPRRVPSRSATPTTPELSYAEEQYALRAAERLLSRTLMNAWVDGGGDMTSELAPTQTHIYLRAPRRFVHPAWAARQNLSRSLDAVLQGFLEDVGAVPPPAGNKAKVKGRGVRTEGAWVGCKGGSAFAAENRLGSPVEESLGGVTDGEDEEIWWAWDGKIVGFSDW